jgi:hypothetical protein
LKRLVAGAVIVCAFAVSARPASAQAARFYLGGGVGLLRLQGTAASPGLLQGPIKAAMGRASLWRFELDLGYSEGSLKDRQGTLASRDFVEGNALLGIRPVRWLALKGGPHARGFLQNGITERWLFWEGRIRADGFVAGPAVRGYIEISSAFTGTTRNAAGSFGSSRGGEAGVIVRIPRRPVWLQLGYGAERSRLATSTPLDAVERFIVGIGIGTEGTR